MHGSSQRIVVLSDTHLAAGCRGAVSAQALRPLWQGAAELIINGDVAEVADEKARGAAARQVLRLQELTEADGVKLTLLSGNHDPLITDRRYLRLAHREVFITHGDILHPAISPWTSHARSLARLHADAVMSLDPTRARAMDARLAAAQHASARQWDAFAEHPESHHESFASPILRCADQFAKAVKAAYYWQTIPRRAMGFARRFAPESRFFIFGHIHRAGIWVDRHVGHERVIINTGAYQTPCNPRAVVIEGQRLNVHKVRFDPAGHALNPTPLRSYRLDHATIAATLDAEGVDRSFEAA